MGTSRKGLILVLILIAGCSFQRHSPAPVDSLYTGNTYKTKLKGSLDQRQYRVKKGDTLYSIAWAADADFRELAKINRLSSPYTIHPGQTLDLIRPVRKSSQTNKPKKSTPSTPKPKPTKASAPKSKVTQVSNVKKMTVDSKPSPRYSETVSLQNSNMVKSQPLSKVALPSRVTRWRWPLKGRIVRGFSATEQGNKGIDIAAAEGTPVRSAAAGKVVYAGSALRGYGKLIIVKHSDEYLSAYAHNKRILVKEQQGIRAGQLIAEVGNTEADSSMLHFEIRYKGKSVDPLRYLPSK